MVAVHENKEAGPAIYTSLDMRYAYKQVHLNKDTARHCNHQIVVG